MGNEASAEAGPSPDAQKGQKSKEKPTSTSELSPKKSTGNEEAVRAPVPSQNEVGNNEEGTNEAENNEEGSNEAENIDEGSNEAENIEAGNKEEEAKDADGHSEAVGNETAPLPATESPMHNGEAGLEKKAARTLGEAKDADGHSEAVGDEKVPLPATESPMHNDQARLERKAARTLREAKDADGHSEAVGNETAPLPATESPMHNGQARVEKKATRTLREAKDTGGHSEAVGDKVPLPVTESPTHSDQARVERKAARTRRPQTISEGMLRGTIEKNNEELVCRDPILDAVAAGSAVRKARQERLERIRRRQQQQQQRGTRPLARGEHRPFTDNNNNQWKISLRRLAKTAASTAKTVAHATAPVISDARQVVLSSATEFAQDVKTEWNKVDRVPVEDSFLSRSSNEEENHKDNEFKATDTSDIECDDRNSDNGARNNNIETQQQMKEEIDTEDSNGAGGSSETAAGNNNIKSEEQKNDDCCVEDDNGVDEILDAALSNNNTEPKREQIKEINLDHTNGVGATQDATEIKSNPERSDPITCSNMNNYVVMDHHKLIPKGNSTDSDSFNISFSFTFDEKKEMDCRGELDDGSAEIEITPGNKCIIEELQIMEEEFETQLESVKTQIDSVFASPVGERNDSRGKPKIRRLLSDDDTAEHEFSSERTHEISFFEKDGSPKQIMAVDSGDMDSSSSTTNDNVLYAQESEDAEKPDRTTSKVEANMQDNANIGEYGSGKEQEGDGNPSDKGDQPGDEIKENTEDVEEKTDRMTSKVEANMRDKASIRDDDSGKERKGDGDSTSNKSDQPVDEITGVTGEGVEEKPDRTMSKMEASTQDDASVVDNDSGIEREGDGNLAERSNKPRDDIKEKSIPCQKDSDEILDAVPEPKVRTRSGRVVKPVRRLIDGCETSIGGENQYGRAHSVDFEIDETEDHALDDTSKTVTQAASTDVQETTNLQLGSNTEASLESDRTTDEVTIQTKPNEKFSPPSMDDEKEEPSNGTTDNSWTEMKPIGDEEVIINSSIRNGSTKMSPMFGLSEDALYQNEEVHTLGDGDGDGDGDEENSTNNAVATILNVTSDHRPFVQRFDRHALKDKKSFVKFVATKLTGFDIEVKEKSNKHDLFDPSSDYPIPDSVFEKRIPPIIESSTSSSVSSPPEIDMALHIEEREDGNCKNDDENDLVPLFDLIPSKGEISRESCVGEESRKLESNLSEEESQRRKRLKQGSIGSQNGSLSSFSTHQRSSKSMSFSNKRSSRRLRRQSSRLTLSLSNTQHTKSPYMTPVENRSLVDDKVQIEAQQGDPAVQLVGWDTDIEANFPSVPDTEEMTEAQERSVIFHETLAAFSSLENIDFLRDLPLSRSEEVPKPTSSLMWRQLIANWKHSESCKAMLARPSSIQLSKLTKDVGFFGVDDDFSSSLSTIQFQLDSGNVFFSNDFVSSRAYSLLRFTNADNYCEADEGFLVLTRYLCDIGPGTSSSEEKKKSTAEEELLQHSLSKTLENNEHGCTIGITEILREAKAQLPNLDKIINCVVNYASQNDPSSIDFECYDVTSSSGVKDYTSIRRKARRKYSGDVLQVKDVLRGEITFPDEASLICGLHCLQSMNGRNTTVPPFQIVRLKNLFRTTSVGKEIYSALPTGYRHILINLKLECGLIIELQFQIAQLFDIMGEEGYQLHHDIMSSETDMKESFASSTSGQSTTKIPTEENLEVTSTHFVRSILTNPTDLAIISRQLGLKKMNHCRIDASNSPVISSTNHSVNSESVGGIGALAAQAALRKSQKHDIKSCLPKLPVGGIAAIAAEAALKKSEKQESEHGAQKPPVVGIAALAAEAALKKSEKKQEDIPKQPVEGIAALAAEAVLKKSEKKEEDTPKQPVVGIATLAAEAALKKSDKQEEDTSKQSVGEIDALPVEVASGKSKNASANEDAPKPPILGIAALAAQAALKKSQKQENKEGITKPSAGSAGGLAALATEAASKKSQKQENKEDPHPTVRGIAALAAETALKKQQKQENENDVPKVPEGDIAAEAVVNESPRAGINSLADQIKIAQEMEDIDDLSTEEESTGEETPKRPTLGIAALAAQAALKKSPRAGINLLADEIKKAQDMEDDDDSSNEKESTGKANLMRPTVGIAALAAEAALKKQQKQENEGAEELPDGGVAALAAQAALEKSPRVGINSLADQIKMAQDMEDDDDSSNEKESTGKANLMRPTVGIAALAAEAALKKSQKRESEDDAPKRPTVGIAALAAEAALKKQQKQGSKDGVPKPPVIGIAALAAEAALKKSQKQGKEEDESKRPTLGIAALAAEAALKKQQKQGNEEGDSKQPTLGIAALAAEAALKKSQKQGKEEDDPTSLEGDITALVSHPTIKKSEETKSQANILSPANEISVKKPGNSEGQKSNDFSLVSLLSAVFEEGVVDATSNPRDVSTLYCLHLLAVALQETAKDKLQPKRNERDSLPTNIIAISRRLLLRSLVISNQATSIGMIGWLGYGSSSVFDRALDLPFEVLQQLSCNMAAEKNWAKASDVLCSLLFRCEQNLPRCHPRTLGSMLDLAGALTEAHDINPAKSIVSRTVDLLSRYLSEVESLFFDRRYFELLCEKDPDRVVSFDDRVDAVGIMQAFCKKFQEELSRNFLKLLGRNHRITLLNHSLVADSFSVLANCLSAGEEKFHTNELRDLAASTSCGSRLTLETPSRYYWSLAHSQYEISLRGWIRTESLIHPNAASVAFSIARCLRELGKRKKAIQLMETLASCLEQKVDDQIKTTITTMKQATRTKGEEPSSIFMVPLNDTETPLSHAKEKGPSFISRRRSRPSASISSMPAPLEKEAVTSYEREHTAVLCLWTMAVLTAEESPDERGRSRALSLLHTASLALQRMISKSKDCSKLTSGRRDFSSAIDEQTRLASFDLYQIVEGEALDLFEPLERIPLAKKYKPPESSGNDSASNKASNKPMAAPSWSVLTPMRQKRSQWTSPRSRAAAYRSAAAAASNTVANVDNSSGATAAGKLMATNQVKRNPDTAFLFRV